MRDVVRSETPVSLTRLRRRDFPTAGRTAKLGTAGGLARQGSNSARAEFEPPNTREPRELRRLSFARLPATNGVDWPQEHQYVEREIIADHPEHSQIDSEEE